MRPSRVGFAICAMMGFWLACVGTRNERAYAASLPADIRPSFDLFAQRCSKCHPLSRPLDSGIDDDAYWGMYVRRMRLQQGSGISAADEIRILEFLRYYAQERRERRTRSSTGVTDAAVVDATTTPQEPTAPASPASGPAGP